MKQQALGIQKYAHIIDGINEVNEARPNFSGIIWDKDIEGIAEALREDGIEEFTISATYTGLVNILDAFKGYGMAIQDVIRIKANTKDFETGEPEEIPAILMKVM